MSYPKDCPRHEADECRKGDCPDYMAVWLLGTCSSGDPLRRAVVLVVEALQERNPPVDLPATLASVDDVRRVCEAAGLRQGRINPEIFWDDGVETWVPQLDTMFSDEQEDVGIAVAIAPGRWRIEMSAFTPGAQLWHAIQAARSAS